MPTYGYLMGKHVTVNMTQAVFDSVEPGVRHVMKIAVHNISIKGQRVRLVPPKEAEFTLTLQNDVDLAPGLEMTAELAYYAESPVDIESTLYVLVGRSDARPSVEDEGEQLMIPVRATLPGAKIAFDQPVDFGVVTPGQQVSRDLVVTNRGSKDGRMSIVGPPGGSKFSIMPLEHMVPSGGSVTFKVDLKCDAELGPLSLKLPVAVSGQMGFVPRATELSLLAEVADPTVELVDGEDKPLAKAELGRLYCGLSRVVGAFLANNGPRPVNFTLSLAAEEGSVGEVEDKSDGAIKVTPTMGRIPAGGKIPLEFLFCPKKRPPPPKGFVAGEETEDIADEIYSTVHFEVLETGQKVPLRLDGVALAARVSLSAGAFNFGDCIMYDHREAKLVLTNRQDVPYAYSLVPPAHFDAAPLKGKIGPMGTAEVILTFKPHQVGLLSGSIKLLGFDGKVATQMIQVRGECTAPDKRVPAGGTTLLPEDFVKPPKFVEPPEIAFPPAPIGAKWVRPAKWEMSESLQGGKVQEGGSEPLNKLTTLTRAKTYKKQMALQPVLDVIDQMDTGLELPPAAIKAAAEHRNYYNTYLKSQREAREARRKARAVPEKDFEVFMFGVDLGLDPFSGCTPLVPPLPSEVQPLFLHHPYGDGYDPKAALSSQLFDPFRIGGKKYKPRPETLEEVNECKASLAPTDLEAISGGPKVLDFGTFSVFTNVTRCFTVLNECRQNILVSIDLNDEADIKQVPPQVVPPNGVAGFDLVFSSADEGPFRRTITYTVNGAHAFKFTAQACVEPIDLGFSTEEAVFRFADGSLDPTISQTIMLHNPGTFPAKYRWEHPDTDSKRPPAFMPSITTGEVPPKKTLPVEIVYTPYLGAPAQHVLTAIVEGGPAKSLYCKADVAESRCTINIKKLDFGSITAGIARERTIYIKNPGQSEAVYSFDEPPMGWVIKPMRAAVRAGASSEISIEVTGVPPEGQASIDLSANLKCSIRCGRPIMLPVHAECRVPELSIEEDEIGFGGVVAGATTWRPFTLVNASSVPATLHLDLSTLPEVNVGLATDPDAAEAAAAMDDRATTIIPDDDAEESPLQLLSFPTNSPPQTSHGHVGDGEAPTAATQQMAESMGRAPAAAEKRVYAIQIPARGEAGSGTLALKLGFAPRGASTLESELNICSVGLPQAAGLRRVIFGEGLKPRLKLTPVMTKLGNCILRDAQFPYTTTATVTNADEEPLDWHLDADAAPADSGITVKPFFGHLLPGETQTITVSYTATVAGPVDVAIPLYIDGGKTPYLMPHFLANAVPPRLTFDRPELILPVVPLGHISRASLYVINEGYDNLQIQAKLPIDSTRVPLTLDFPEGQLVGVCKERIMITVSFMSKKPTAFTSIIELIDTDGTRFPLPVTATTDNSVITAQPYLNAISAADPKSLAIVCREGKPPSLIPPAPPPAPKAGMAAKDLRKLKLADATSVFMADKRTDKMNSAIEAATSRGASIMLAYISSALLALPAAIVGGRSGGSFPAMFTQGKAQAMYDVISLTSGKSVPLPDPPADRKNEKAALRHEVASYDAVLSFLRAHGALLASTKPELLLPLDEYLKIMAGNGAPLGRKERREVRKDHAVRHPEAWLDVLFQTVKIFVLGRVTPRAFKSLPGMDTASVEIAKEVSTPGYSSLLYSTPEILLLRWLEHHAAACPPTALGVGNPLDDVGGILNAFDVQLRDGHVFAKVLLSHCPFLARVDPMAPPLTGSGDAEYGTSIDNLYPRPCKPAQCAANLGLVLAALQTIGLRFGASAGMPELVPAELYEASPREMLLFALYLYQHLPHYVSKATVSFTGGLHEPLSRSIELSNPGKKPIVYEVRLEGAPCFRVGAPEVRLDGRTTLGFKIECLAVFTGSHAGRVIFLSRGDGIGTAHASTLVFDLASSIEVGAALENFSTASKLYMPVVLPVVVTNPFNEPATFRVNFTESRPPLDLPKVGPGKEAPAGGKDAGGGASMKQGFAAASAVARAAKMAGLSVAAMGGGASASDDPSKKLPSTFWSASSTIAIEPRGQITVPVQFLPFQLGEYVATILFADEAVGEFSYELRGTSSLPPPIETLSFTSEAASSSSKDMQLPFRNPHLEKARTLVLERSVREKERMSQLWGKEPLLRGPVPLQISYGSSHFSGPQAIDLVDNERRGGRGGSNPRTAGGSTFGSLAGSGVATPRGKDAPPQTASADANKLQMRFVPAAPGTYTSELLLLSPLDVRLYDLTGFCSAPGLQATLEFTTPARMPLRQELPIVNNSESDWSVSANCRGEGWSGPQSVKIPAKATGHYPLEFNPDWICERDGELILTNLASGDKYVYTLKGKGEEPLAEGNITVDCKCRASTPITFSVFNVSEKGEAGTLRVDSDLLHVSGQQTVKVNGRGKQVAPGGQGAERVDYVLKASPQLGGMIHGSVTFTSADGRYLWYTVEMRAEPPPCEKRLEIKAPLRKVISVEIPISNPMEAELEFAVLIVGDGLLGDESIRVEGKGEASYELLFSPLVAGSTAGSIAFINPHAGEFWYELELTGEPTAPVELPLLRCAVGGSTTTEIAISNPIGEELALQMRIDNPRNFKLEGPKAAGGALILPPYGELSATLTYTPSALEETQSAMISLVHSKLGEWVYSARGLGHVPTDMPPTMPSAPLGHTTSGTINFRNPFDQPLTLNLALDQPMHHSDDPTASPPFELLARRTSALVIPAGTSVQLPFSFVARDMGEAHATVVLHGDYKGRQLTWRFPIIGEAISRPLNKPIQLHVAARQPLSRELTLPLPGLVDSDRDEPFTYELDLDAQSAALIEGSLTLTPLQRTLAGGTLVMAVEWRPLRPVRTSAALIVRKASGGRWRFDIVLEAGEPQPDDVIVIEAPIHKTAQVQFKLCNAFDEDAPFQAYFSSESATVFNVTPGHGVLTRAGTAGTLFTVSYTPVEYGKPVKGRLIVLTEEMQWSYEVRGQHPHYEAPNPMHTKVDHVLDPNLSLRLGRVPKTNFLKRNMGQ